MKKGTSKVMGLVISLIIGLVALLFILGFTTNKISFLSHSSDIVTQINDPERLSEEGNQYYNDGDFEYAIKIFDRAARTDENYRDIDKIKLMLALSYAANSDFSNARTQFQALSKDLQEKKLYPGTQAILNQITDFLGGKEFDLAMVKWDCCDYKEMGFIYSYGVCEKICRYGSCKPESCSDVPVVVNR